MDDIIVAIDEGFSDNPISALYTIAAVYKGDMDRRISHIKKKYPQIPDQYFVAILDKLDSLMDTVGILFDVKREYNE